MIRDCRLFVLSLWFCLVIPMVVPVKVKANELDPYLYCTAKADVIVYPSYDLKKENSRKVPLGTLAVVDLFMKTTHGPILISGMVQDRASRLTKENGSYRWFMLATDWTCSETPPKPSTEV